MDIDDILADVDSDAIPLEIRDYQALTRAWVTERSAPEILPWPDDLMERVLERIRKQVRRPLQASNALSSSSAASYVLALPKSTLMPSTISPIPLPKPASPQASFSMLRLILPYCTLTITRPSSHSSLHHCRKWMIRLGESVWWRDQMWIKLCL